MDFDQQYRAIEARDARFDGQFVTAVHTTGIYCRPSCPARTPKAENVSFYPTSAAAQEAGYRACKRCLPEAVPGSPEWNRRNDTAARAVRLIGDGVVDREGVAGLAGRLGYSTRQLTRILRRELGAGPLALARAQRAQTARALLTDTHLPVAEVAFAAGFGSVRQCNDTVQAVYNTTPVELRARARPAPGGASGVTPGTLTLRLPVRHPFDGRGLLDFLAARAVPAVESVDGDTYHRVLALPGGPAWCSVTMGEEGAVTLTAQLTALADLGVLVTRVRRLFDLDADPVAVDTALAGVSELAGAVAEHPGVRIPGAVDGLEMLVRAILGQQVSVARATGQLTRLVAALGTPVTAPDGRRWRLFPTARQLADGGAEVIRGPAARTRAVVGAARRLADGELDLSVGDDGDDLVARLVAEPGIGPWTAAYVRLRLLGDPDVWLHGDAALRAGCATVGCDGPAMADLAARCAPWRSYAALHLWRLAARPAAP